MRKLRSVFFKKDRAKYISHLDLYKFMQRTFKRADIDVWYTEGFNPHLYIMFPLPLSLGFESDCEIMDFNIIDDTLSDDYIKDRLNSVLTEGIQILEVYEPVMKHTEIAFSDYDIYLVSENGSLTNEKFKEFMASEQIIIMKKTKQKTFKEVDIKPFCDVSMSEDCAEGLHFKIRMPSGSNANYNPSLLIDAFCKAAGSEADLARIKRTAVITADGKNFR